MTSQPSDTKRFLLMTLLAVWVFVFAASVYRAAKVFSLWHAGYVVEWPRTYWGWYGDSAMMQYIGQQLVAALLALAIFGVGLSWERESGGRRLSQLPLALALFQAVAILGILYWTGMWS